VSSLWLNRHQIHHRRRYHHHRRYLRRRYLRRSPSYLSPNHLHRHLGVRWRDRRPMGYRLCSAILRIPYRPYHPRPHGHQWIHLYP
jgi:hypothetical protein